MKKSTWSGASSVLFIPFSKRLKEAVIEGVRRSGEKIKVVEQGGRSLKSILQKSDPFRETECTDPKCPVCTVKEGGQEKCIKGSCTVSNIGYVVTCLDCQEAGLNRVYEGESARCLRERAEEHLRDVRAKKTTSGLYRHTRDEHAGICPTFRFQVRKIFEDPLTRQVEEGVRIEGVPDDHLMNTKQEWAPPVLARIRIE